MSIPKLILTNGDQINTWFDDFFKENKYKKIGLKFSGGVDSTLLLFFLAKFITETENCDKIIFPVLVEATNFEITKSPEKSQKILELIRDMYPKVQIKDITFRSYTRTGQYISTVHKSKYIDKIFKEIDQELMLDIFLSGTTSNPKQKERELYNITGSPIVRDPESIFNHWTEEQIKTRPWFLFDKKFIAAQYRKYNLMDNIYPLTESCIMESHQELLRIGANGFPCKKCYWCQEKFWAFGSYDGGIK